MHNIMIEFDKTVYLLYNYVYAETHNCPTAIHFISNVSLGTPRRDR